MISMNLARAAAVLGCETTHGDTVFTGISTDSRQVSSGMLFAALSGSSFDGHDYIEQARDLGAVAVLVSRPVSADLPVLLLDDVLEALGKLAHAWRRQCAVGVIGITGSNGKTTVKEMISSVLRRNASVLATEGNFNNELGLPLTLFRLRPAHDYAVLEMGASNPGDIAYLAGIARPDTGVITNIGPAHLQGFIDVEGVARAKGELFAALPHDGVAVINALEPWAELWKQENKAGTTCLFGVEGENNVYARQDTDSVVVCTPKGEFELQLSLPGEHNLSNALAATAVCVSLGISLDDIRSGLKAVKPLPGRLRLLRAASGCIVIDDTYNANPASLYAALQVLARQPGEPWLVLGDMKELGADSRKMHAELGDAARNLGVRRLFAVGDVSPATVAAFGDMAFHFDSRDALIEAVKSQLRPGVACLVKGSRSMGMEHVVRAITGTHEHDRTDD